MVTLLTPTLKRWCPPLASNNVFTYMYHGLGYIIQQPLYSSVNRSMYLSSTQCLFRHRMQLVQISGARSHQADVTWPCTVRKLSAATFFITNIYRLLVVVCGSATIFWPMVVCGSATIFWPMVVCSTTTIYSLLIVDYMTETICRLLVSSALRRLSTHCWSSTDSPKLSADCFSFAVPTLSAHGWSSSEASRISEFSWS